MYNTPHKGVDAIEIVNESPHFFTRGNPWT